MRVGDARAVRPARPVGDAIEEVQAGAEDLAGILVPDPSDEVADEPGPVLIGAAVFAGTAPGRFDLSTAIAPDSFIDPAQSSAKNRIGRASAPLRKIRAIPTSSLSARAAPDAPTSFPAHTAGCIPADAPHVA